MLTSNTKAKPRTAHFSECSYGRFFFSCQQAAGELRDSFGGPVATKFDAGYTDAEAWANAGFLTTGNSAITDYMTRVADPTNSWDGTTHTAILALRLKKATPGSNEVIAGCFTSSTHDGGWQLNATSTGTLQLQMKPADGGAAHTITIASGFAPLDGTERLCMWAIPRDAVSAQMYVDGVAAGTAAMSGGTKNFAGGHILNIGASRAGSAKTAQFATLQLYTIERNLADLKMTQIAEFMTRFPHRPLPDWLLEV
jgi:hypothetical protein